MIYKYKNYNLAYNIGGDAEGFPTFINYGLIGDIDVSSLNTLAIKAGLKLIILERPGYGTSDFIEMQSYDDWSDIVGSFFDFLNIKKFAVIGISAGAPYAYAIAHKFPDRTKGVYILSGLPYVLDEAVFDNYGKSGIYYQKIWNYSQSELEIEMYSIYQKYTKGLYKLMLPKSLNRQFNASLANNCSGMAQSVKLQTQDWGFDVYSLPMKINYWHARYDSIVPFKAVKVMVGKMKNVQLKVKGKTHIPSKRIIKEVLRTIKHDT